MATYRGPLQFTNGQDVSIVVDPRFGTSANPTQPAGWDGGSDGLDTEAVQDVVAAMLLAGPGISVSYDDPAGTVTITNTGATDDPGTGAVGACVWTGEQYPPRPTFPLVIWRGPLDPRLIAGSGFLLDVDLWAQSEGTVPGDPTNTPPAIDSLTVTASGMSATATWAASDPEDDTLTFTVSWGDGTSTSPVTSPTGHTYTTTGKHTVTVTAFDGSEYGAASQEITLTAP